MRTYLLTQTDVTNEVSTRVYFDVLPQGAELPAVVIERDTAQITRHLSGTQALRRSVCQVDVYAGNHPAVINASDAVVTALEMYTGSWTNTINVRRSYITDLSKSTDNPADGSQAFRHIDTLTCVVWYE